MVTIGFTPIGLVLACVGVGVAMQIRRQASA
jgi:hypothetical protein